MLIFPTMHYWTTYPKAFYKTALLLLTNTHSLPSPSRRLRMLSPNSQILPSTKSREVNVKNQIKAQDTRACKHDDGLIDVWGKGSIRKNVSHPYEHESSLTVPDPRVTYYPMRWLVIVNFCRQWYLFVCLGTIREFCIGLGFGLWLRCVRVLRLLVRQL